MKQADIVIFIAVTLLFPSVLLADKIHLENGKVIEGQVVDTDGDEYEIRMKNGISFRVKKGEVRRIEKIADPAFDLLTEEKDLFRMAETAKTAEEKIEIAAKIVALAMQFENVAELREQAIRLYRFAEKLGLDDPVMRARIDADNAAEMEKLREKTFRVLERLDLENSGWVDVFTERASLTDPELGDVRVLRLRADAAPEILQRPDVVALLAEIAQLDAQYKQAHGEILKIVNLLYRRSRQTVVERRRVIVGNVKDGTVDKIDMPGPSCAREKAQLAAAAAKLRKCWLAAEEAAKECYRRLDAEARRTDETDPKKTPGRDRAPEGPGDEARRDPNGGVARETGSDTGPSVSPKDR